MPDAPPPLAIDGGPATREAAWEPPAPPAPAADASPVSTLEADLARSLGLPAALVVATGDPAWAYRAAVTASAGDGEAVLPAVLAEPLAEAARTSGLTPVPADVDTDTGAISTRGLARALSPAVRLVAVVHAFGHPPAMADLHRVASEAGVPIVEDASDALGASYRDAPVGAMGSSAVFAFGSGRLLTGGGAPGALLVVRDASAAGAAREDAPPLPDEAARVALAELRGAEEELLWRRRLAWELTFNLRGTKAIAGMTHGRWIHHGYGRYVVRLRGPQWKRTLEATVAALRAEGVPCDAACGPSLHLDQRVRADLDGDERLAEERFPVASRLPREMIAIPIHGGLTSKDMDTVAAALRKLEHWST